MKKRGFERFPGSAGFTLTELLVVVGLIAVMAAVGLPNMLAYIRNYTIEGAAKEVASELQTARFKAISRNVNLGVLLHIRDNGSYQWVIEDDVTPQSPAVADNWATHAAKSLQVLLDTYPDQSGPIKRLPTGVEFVGTGATDAALRYNRFGGWCEPDPGTECPEVDAGFTGTKYVLNDAQGATIELLQPTTGLRRVIRVGAGGRVQIDRS
jgi:prepilin-type N-terminal cleavage/methylation domain-containing protein